MTASGSDAKSEVATGEGRLQLGSRVFALEGALGVRAIKGTLGHTLYRYSRMGISSLIDIGATGFTTRVSMGVYSKGGVAGTDTVSGHETLSAIEYKPRRLPILFTLGYRSELFEVSAGGATRPERSSGIIFGTGLCLRR